MISQGTPEWHAARLGIVTASRVADVIAKTKSGPSASRAGYLAELVAERLTGRPAADTYQNADMRRGHDLEPIARIEYEIRTGSLVETTGLIRHETLEAGASPDGLLPNGGVLEIKCPRTHVHISYLEAGEPPSKYVPQMLWQIACTRRQWCDFVSYDPHLPEPLSLFVCRFVPTAGQIHDIENEVAAFLDEVRQKTAALLALINR